MLKSIILGVALMLPTVSLAQGNCAPRGEWVSRLSDKYHEQSVGGGVIGDEDTIGILEVWTAPEERTFTILLTNVHGISCLLAAGTDWFIETEESPQGEAL